MYTPSAKSEHQTTRLPPYVEENMVNHRGDSCCHSLVAMATTSNGANQGCRRVEHTRRSFDDASLKPVVKYTIASVLPAVQCPQGAAHRSRVRIDLSSFASCSWLADVSPCRSFTGSLHDSSPSGSLDKQIKGLRSFENCHFSMSMERRWHFIGRRQNPLAIHALFSASMAALHSRKAISRSRSTSASLRLLFKGCFAIAAHQLRISMGVSVSARKERPIWPRGSYEQQQDDGNGCQRERNGPLWSGNIQDGNDSKTLVPARPGGRVTSLSGCEYNALVPEAKDRWRWCIGFIPSWQGMPGLSAPTLLNNGTVQPSPPARQRRERLRSDSGTVCKLISLHKSYRIINSHLNDLVIFSWTISRLLIY
ncbi:hypothetical protein B0T17DRAFT_509092 [Bombardia bombarda]|uniref:Uncharacterized protein n=1 Tax=Bombardia bombarda TaxID=252184 RepID=A0AA40C2A9_9PEZI|nr:hypothetical protein B0T17DRAFT_509092 [Bombardia bombarda]